MAATGAASAAREGLKLNKKAKKVETPFMPKNTFLPKKDALRLPA